MQHELHKGQAKTQFCSAVYTRLDFALDALHAALEQRCQSV